MTGVVTRATKGVPLTATDHDNNLEVTVSLHKSATEPSPTYACMLWADTNNDLLKMRNKANDAWITMGALDTTGAFSDNNLADQDQLSELSDVTITSVADNEVLAYDSTSSEWINQTASEAGLATSAQGSLADSALQDGDTVSSLTITSADINGGTVDGITSLTQTNVAADATDVELKYSGSTKLATTSTGIDVTGTVTAENGSALITDNAIDIEPYGGGSSQGGLGAVAGGVVAVNGNNQLRINTQSTRRAQFDSNGDISFYEDTGTTAKFFWDASAESLGIGTTSPTQRLQVDGGAVRITGNYGSIANNQGLMLGYTGDNANYYAVGANGGGVGQHVFYGYNYSTGSGSERMRIDSSGNVLVGGTTGSGSIGKAYLEVGDSSGGFGQINIGGATYTPDAPLNIRDVSLKIASFFYGATKVGSITTNGSSTAYNTSSDYRLKEDWQPMSGSIDRLKNLNPVNFAWKADGSRVDGFLAHEAAEVVPEAVTGEKDAVEAIGNITDAEGAVIQENVTEPAELAEGQTWTKTEDRPVYQGIDQSKLVPLLTAALQEAVSKIEALETRIAALEA
jgi:hypothetical protein